jgi:hypothetical protein
MANNYVQWSEEIVGLTDEEIAWVEKYIVSPDFSDAELDDMRNQIPAYVDALEFYDMFEAKVFDRDLWMHSEYGGIEAAIDIVGLFLETFRPDKNFILRWAEYCDAPRIGEFGGGACKIYVDRVKCIHTSDIERME